MSMANSVTYFLKPLRVVLGAWTSSVTVWFWVAAQRKTRPIGFSFVPPVGPAIPVTAMAMVVLAIARAVPQACRGRRDREGLRDQPQLPQRGRRLQPLTGVRHAG